MIAQVLLVFAAAAVLANPPPPPVETPTPIPTHTLTPVPTHTVTNPYNCSAAATKESFLKCAQTSGQALGLSKLCATCSNTLNICRAAVSYKCSQCFACSTRQAQGTVNIICNQATAAAQTACFRQAACDGILPAGSICTIGGAAVPCPVCPTQSKKGLLGLLGLLGLIPLILCCLLCILAICLIRRKKAGKDVHFATFDPALAAPPAFGTCTQVPIVYPGTATAAPACTPVGTFAVHP